MVTGDGEGLAGRQTESRVEMEGAREETGGARADQMEGGARTETGGTLSRRSQAGPRPQSRWWPMEEPTEGGAMVEEWPPTPGGRPTAVEQVEVEPEAATESRRARMKPRIRRAKVEPEASATEV